MVRYYELWKGQTYRTSCLKKKWRKSSVTKVCMNSVKHFNGAQYNMFHWVLQHITMSFRGNYRKGLLVLLHCLTMSNSLLPRHSPVKILGSQMVKIDIFFQCVQRIVSIEIVFYDSISGLPKTTYSEGFLSVFIHYINTA